MAAQLGLVVHGTILAAAVRMMNAPLERASHDEDLSQNGECQIAVQPVADSPADDAAGEEVDEHGQIQPSLPRPDVGDVDAPFLVGR